MPAQSTEAAAMSPLQKPSEPPLDRPRRNRRISPKQGELPDIFAREPNFPAAKHPEFPPPDDKRFVGGTGPNAWALKGSWWERGPDPHNSDTPDPANERTQQ